MTGNKKRAVQKEQTAEEKLKVAMNTIDKLKEEKAVLETRIVNTRATQKEFSDYFLNKKSEQQAFKNLSETKRHLESKHEDLLKTIVDNKKVTNDEFNKQLVKFLEIAVHK